MKQKLFLVAITISLIVCSVNLKAQGNDSCTRAWLNTASQLTSRHLSAQTRCAISVGMNWATMDAAGGIMDISCSFDAYSDFIDLLNLVAIQFEACYA